MTISGGRTEQRAIGELDPVDWNTQTFVQYINRIIFMMFII